MTKNHYQYDICILLKAKQFQYLSYVFWCGVNDGLFLGPSTGADHYEQEPWTPASYSWVNNTVI